MLNQFKDLDDTITLNARIDKIFYDIYSQRYIVILYFNSFFISQKNSITDIFLCERNESYKFSTVLYLINLNKKVVVFQAKYYYIKYIDIEDGKNIYSFKFKEKEI